MPVRWRFIAFAPSLGALACGGKTSPGPAAKDAPGPFVDRFLAKHGGE